jgi:hypothetical protein
MPDAASSKPHFGAPIGNKNAQKHGLYAKDAGRVDLRRREDRAVSNALRAIGLRRRAREGPSLADIAAEYANKGDEAKEGRESSSLAAADLSTASDSADKTNTVAPCESCETCERSLVGETAEGGGS